MPVGGASSHCAVSAHRGMVNMKGFDDLYKLEVGDTFVFWTLGDPYCYKIYSIEIVEPYDSSSLSILPNKDLATLITCTPYGVNSHRLLVHGERCPYDEVQDDGIISIFDLRLFLLILAILIALFAVIYFLYRKLKKHNQKADPKHSKK